MSTIVVKLVGGLCNQLFQYCLGRNLADKNNSRLIFDTSYYKTVKHCKFELDLPFIRVDSPTEEDSKLNYQLIQESSMSFIPEILDLKGNLVLNGYWQSPKYLTSKIVKEISPNQHVITPGIITGSNVIAVHVRGNDYKGWKKFDVCNYEYYNKAIELVKSKEENPIVVVFTDDVEYSKYMLYDISKTTELTYSQEKGLDALYHIARCGHLIGSNSTFAWWGYKLRDRWKDGTVTVFPNRWFNPDGTNQHNEINLYEIDMKLIEV